ncbi:MerR family transcriptional regulator [Paenibacillus physcomitrellae]|uniref:HTH-type transcriptional regulator YfmP n=1 Tax=Paenibacillus physcomitrellae TaxID=1619311 RepID=A0ABQ1FW12_9BACL|nr:MerR family transcriptional regulator [Paenibacillus physcomitrellae]GGA32338.1 HTH-type transcriptional regulator YfmP [Paenibacillus physcomitrellae]
MLYKIDEVARECGLTKRTIRYYEEIGLLPSPQRSEGGMRLYSQNDIDLLKKIVSAREVLGFSLQELQQYVQYAEVLAGQRQAYLEKMNSLSLEERKNKLMEIDRTVTDQLELMEQKIRNIRGFQEELLEFQKLVKGGLKKLDE